MGLLLLGAAITDSVAPPVRPWDDQPWVRLAPSSLSLEDLDGTTGLTREAVVSKLGRPLRARRDSLVPSRCTEVYVYALDVGGERAAAGLCVTPEGRVDGLALDSPGLSFDLRAMICGGPPDMSRAQGVAILMGIWRRLRPPRLTRIRER